MRRASVLLAASALAAGCWHLVSLPCAGPAPAPPAVAWALMTFAVAVVISPRG